jgi:hypothetical protein
MKLILALVVCIAAPVLAQQKPGNHNELVQICSGFLEQSAGGVSGDKAALCNCLATETASRLSMPEMQAYAQATVESKAPPDAVMKKMEAIAVTCLTQAQGRRSN